MSARFDVILNTVSAALPIDAYLSKLRVGGVMANVGAPPENLSYNAFSLLGGLKVLAGSLIGGIAETQQMLDFCAEHGVGAEVEVIAANQINAAYERVENSDVGGEFDFLTWFEYPETAEADFEELVVRLRIDRRVGVRGA